MALDKNQIAQRIAQEVKNGYYVNLGIGIPTLVANYVRNDIEDLSHLKEKRTQILLMLENKLLLNCLALVFLIVPLVLV